MKWLMVLMLIAVAGVTRADSVVPVRTMRANTIITAADVAMRPGNTLGFASVAEVVGMETRVALYAGRTIQPADIGPPALVRRNQIVPLIYRQAGLVISAEGRALGRGAAGEIIQVMNVASRATLFGRILQDGTIDVGNP